MANTITLEVNKTLNGTNRHLDFEPEDIFIPVAGAFRYASRTMGRGQTGKALMRYAGLAVVHMTFVVELLNRVSYLTE